MLHVTWHTVYIGQPLYTIMMLSFVFYLLYLPKFPQLVKNFLVSLTIIRSRQPKKQNTAKFFSLYLSDNRTCERNRARIFCIVHYMQGILHLISWNIKKRALWYKGDSPFLAKNSNPQTHLAAELEPEVLYFHW